MTSPTDPSAAPPEAAPPETAAPPATAAPSAPEALTAALSGRFVTPDSDDWDGARQAWNLAVDLRPAAVFHPESAADVVAVVRHCAATGRRIAMQTTGHGGATLEHLGDTVLVRTERLRGVEIDCEASIARVAAGTQWHEVAGPAAEYGLAALSGSSPMVGVVGYSLGGGIGWLARQYGLACNSIVAAEVVTADGEQRRVDAEHEPELFWALRGGGGAFAAVTALEFRLYPVRQVYAGTLMWPIEQAADALHAWRAWTTEVPDSVTSVGRLLRLPPIPEVPEFLQGRELAVVEAAFLGEAEEADRWLRPLRALQPEFDTFDTLPVPALGQLHGDPEEPVPAFGDHRLLADLPAEAVDAILEVAGPGRSSPLLSLEVRHLGGALARSAPTHGALDRVAGEYLIFGLGLPMSPELGSAIHAAFDGVRSALAPWDAGREYLNFAEQPASATRLFGAETLVRLQTVRRAYDPDGRFVSNHSIEA